MKLATQNRAVEWRDLVALTPAERFHEICLPLPWLVLSLFCYERSWLIGGAFCSFYFFLTGLRQSHGAQHYSLGVSRKAQDAILLLLSLSMFASMHAVQTSHWHHHQHCLDEDDFEGLTADLPWWRAILAGPRFIINLHTGAWDLATLRNRIWIASESAGILLLIVVIMTLGSISLRWHVAAMLVGECLTGFFAVWTVHHGCGRGEPGRTQRTEWLNLLSCSMFFHAEHHLFPAVPTAHLAELARRLDATGSTVNRQQVITLRSQDENGPEPPSRRMASRMTSAGTLVRSFPSDTKEQLCTLNCINSD